MLSQEIRAGSYEGVHSEILQRKKKQQPRLQITTSTVVHFFWKRMTLDN